VNKRIEKKRDKEKLIKAMLDMLDSISPIIPLPRKRARDEKRLHKMIMPALFRLSERVCNVWIRHTIPLRRMTPRDTVTLTLPTISGAGYRVYGIAPIPVRLQASQSARIEPTKDGYNLYEVDR